MVSEELKKMFEGRIAMQDMHYVGKACYGRLDENLRGKIELGQGFLDSGYIRLTVSVLERTNGLVDQMKFLISDVTGLKQENDGERMAGPELSSYKDSVWSVGRTGAGTAGRRIPGNGSTDGKAAG